MNIANDQSTNMLSKQMKLSIDSIWFTHRYL